MLASGRNRALLSAAGLAVLCAAVWCGLQYFNVMIALVSTQNAIVQIDPASDKAYVIAYFEDHRAERIVVGQPVAIAIAGPSDRTLPGHVVDISRQNALLRISGDGDGSMEASDIMIPVLIAFDDDIDSSKLPETTSVRPTVNTDPRVQKPGTRPPVCVGRAERPVSGPRANEMP
ncbi:HlyD family efflux transporter periplasmic adaptor subunit [Bradyrhizobium sp. STM 3809]|uniref:HlyD family efflux transporter periplasmic adaptor subunit n=1 Tax=Bradyrhizobium sp. STM 3809 TaxID=551936 RepID=UPI0002407DB3|nr:HlyD family efflux transporter periplasmic adaptor subunit [Bradyrhizobium sp. STM 3809]CCE03127.1 exported hypothetical protein [Bradyrhizobium sp. STM 3809]